jgi:hypothetical protein
MLEPCESTIRSVMRAVALLVSSFDILGIMTSRGMNAMALWKSLFKPKKESYVVKLVLLRRMRSLLQVFQ